MAASWNSGQRTGRLESQWATVDGLPVHARASVDPVPADRPPVVLVHGAGISSRYMVPTAERLAPFHQVYAPDLPGYGLSGKPDRVLDVPGRADALAAWMQAVGLERAALLGNSAGCQIVADLAVRHPERLERAVLVGPTVDPRARTFRQQAWQWLVNNPREPQALGAIIARDYRDAGLRRVLRSFQVMLEDRIEEKLPRVRVPTLVVRGARDAIVPQPWAEEATRLLPMGRLVVIPGAAHTVNYNAPLELVRVVRPFLDAARRHETGRSAA